MVGPGVLSAVAIYRQHRLRPTMRTGASIQRLPFNFLANIADCEDAERDR